MKTCPECFGNGYEYDNCGYKTGVACSTCGGSGNVSQEEYDKYHDFYGRQYEDGPVYVEEDWRISRDKNKVRSLSSVSSANHEIEQGGRCLIVLLCLVLLPPLILLQIV